MKKITLFFLLILLVISSCSSTKSAISSIKKHSKLDRIIINAIEYEGTRYKYGGTTKRGMDCSGLIYTAFLKENIWLPRISKMMATKGKNISFRNIKRGDLLFFKTSRKNSINHVGLVTSVKNGKIRFVHSTTSRGVIVSSLSEKYWKRAYSKAKRIL